MSKTLIISLGGNSMIRANERGTIEEQYSHLWEATKQIQGLLTSENSVVITHGNGPQVGNLLIAIEAAHDLVPPIPLDVCGAATQGLMGYMIQQTLANRLREVGLKHDITTVITQVIVDKDDPAFKKPTKPIGPFYSLDQAQKLIQERAWEMIEDSGRSYRRVVSSPIPVNIQQARIIKAMLASGEIVIAAGGGGIPVIREPDGRLYGVEGVIDKDYASSRLAIEIDADAIITLTSVEKVFRDFGRPSQKELDRLNVTQAKKLLAEGHFGKGSMEPKIIAAIEFLEETSRTAELNGRQREVIITLPETLLNALQGKTGTRITL